MGMFKNRTDAKRGKGVLFGLLDEVVGKVRQSQGSGSAETPEVPTSRYANSKDFGRRRARRGMRRSR